MTLLTPTGHAPASPSPAPAGWRPGAVAFGCLVLGGALAGLGHLVAPLAWLGVALVAAGLHACRHAGWAAAGLGLGALAGLVLGHPWHAGFVGYYLPWKDPLAVWGVTLAVGVVMAVCLKAPVLAGWAVARRFGVPVTLWLPAAWAIGEAALHAWSGVSHADWLYSQWEVRPVLRAVGLFGWTPALLLCLAICAGAGEAIVRRRRRLALAPVALALLLALLPPLAPGDPAAFDGLGAVHVAGTGHTPRQAPPGTRLLVWPEVGWPIVLGVPEGPGGGRRVPPPIPVGEAAHLLGAHSEGPDGLLNSLIALAPDGTVQAARAKRLLFPVAERAVAGAKVPTMPDFRPGTASPVLVAGGRRVGTLICLEALDGAMAAEAKRDGAELLAVCSSDMAMGASGAAARQMLAVAALRAVETGLPVVRASRGGPAALILPDGRVLASSTPGREGVLTRGLDAPLTGRAAPRGAIVDAAVLFSAASPELGAALPADRCHFYRLEGFEDPGVTARTVVLVGHSSPPFYLGQPADRVAAALASFKPELVVLDTCYGASTPILEALAARGLRAIVVAPPFQIPQDGFVYGPGFLATASPHARAALVRTQPDFPLLRWRLEPLALERLRSATRAMDEPERARRLKRLPRPYLKTELGPGLPVLAEPGGQRPR